MPKESFGIPTITGTTLEEIRQQTQFWLTHVSNQIDRLAGLRGSPTLHSNLSAGGHSITDLGNPSHPESQDAVPASQALTFTTQADGVQGWDAFNFPLFNLPSATLPTQATNLDQLRRTAEEAVVTLGPSAAPVAPPVVSLSSQRGVLEQQYALGDHTHGVTFTTFPAVGEGFTTVVTSTARAAVAGPIVVLFLPELLGTSASNVFQISGMPASLVPAQTTHHLCLAADNGANVVAVLRLNAGSALIDCFSSITLSNWTAAGLRYLAAMSCSYLIA